MRDRQIIKTMNSFSLLVKPVSADCNMDCSYCFYLPKKELYPATKKHRMPLQVLEKLISGYLNTSQNQYIFGWQGGEPSLAGLDFFNNVIKLQKKHGKPGMRVSNGFQTNATLITDSFARHLSDYNYLVGVSFDGPQYLHNQNRIFKTVVKEHKDKIKNIKKGSFNRVLKTIETLKRSKVEFNILTLVSSTNVEKPDEVYDFLRNNGFYYHQYIPCVEYDSKLNLKPCSVDAKAWGKFLIEIFNRWYPEDIYKISVRFFDSILNKLINKNAGSCEMLDNCNHYLLVEYNGDVYPCDFFVEKDWKLGNIMTDSWEKILNSERLKKFSCLKSEYNNECKSCDHLMFCYGDCLKHRKNLTAGPAVLSTLCQGLKMFYDACLPTFKEIASRIKA